MARVSTSILKYSADGKTDLFTIGVSGASATEVVDVDCKDAFNASFIVQATFPETSSTTGLTITLHYGIGPDDPDMGQFSFPCMLGGVTNPAIVVSDTYDSVTTAAYLTNQSSPQTLNHFFSLNPDKAFRYARIKMANNDSTYSPTIKIFASQGQR